jgi:aminoglycoside phosphotransferase (APT) family kinase protein
MSAAPPEHKTWKDLLLAGNLDEASRVAGACGRVLGRLHAASWGDSSIAARLADRTYFDQLRLDPYYRHVGRMHEGLAPAIERLIESVWQHRRSLVHGDFSPKNLLVWPGHLMLIDFEVGHYGDPAFDLGFFLTHLVLKSIRADERRQDFLAMAAEFWRTYCDVLATDVAAAELELLEQRMLWNLAGCMLARVDGKSPVEYLSPAQQQRVRAIAMTWIIDPPRTWDEAQGQSVIA